jgi:hypothetical protein
VNTGPDEERLEHAASQAADGVTPPIAEAAGESDDARGMLEGLRVLARLARVHRTTLERTEDERTAGVTALFSWGPLVVVEAIGSGSFGEVYRALDPALGRDVALKLRPAWESGEGPAARRWLDEARRLARVRHANVVQVYGAAIHEGRPGLWMELVAGQTLEQQLEQRGPLGWREACAVGIELCAALAAVHGAGLVHQDVKASNVMREGGPGASSSNESSGRIVLMDFGAGQRLDSHERGTGGAFGTPISCAPEVLSGEPPTPRSDIYSLGALLYRLVTGRHLIDADSVIEVAGLARSGRSVPLRSLRPDLPPGFVATVERAFDVDASRRWGSAAEFERALTAALVSQAPTEHVAGARPGQRAWLIAAIAVVIVGAGLWTMWSVRRSTQAGGPSRSAGSIPAEIAGGRTSGAGPSQAHSPPGQSSAKTPSVEARFLRAAPGGAEEIHGGDLVAPGDQLALSIDTSERLWVYVLDEDRVGSVNVLFPISGLAPSNPIAAGAHRLPGARRGHALDWQVTSAGGRESFLFIASRTPLSGLEARIASVPRAREGASVSYARLDDQTLSAMRGVSGLAPSRIVPTVGHDRLETLAASLAARPDSSVWIERVNVSNPGP